MISAAHGIPHHRDTLITLLVQKAQQFDAPDELPPWCVATSLKPRAKS